MKAAKPGAQKPTQHRDVPAIHLTRPPRVLRGPAYDQRQPVIVADVMVKARGVSAARFDKLLGQLVGGAQAVPATTDSKAAGRGGAVDLADIMLRWAIVLQRQAGQPVFDSGLVIRAEPSGRQPHTLVMPYCDPVVGRKAFGWALTNVSRLAGTGQSASLLPKLRHETAQLLQQLRNLGPSTLNAVNFLSAAYELQIPWVRLTANVYQIGQGGRARWLNSSINDRTSAIGVQLARNKLDTAVVLHRAGIPVPELAVASSVDNAVKIAERLGYPVVVKPVDRDGGVGVAAGLDDEPTLRKAFGAAAKLSRRVLVEKHVEGRDFRLTVIDGRVRWVIERVPGGVTGDGVHSVSALLAKLNADPRRGASPSHALRTIDFDDEAADLLKRQKLTPESIPAAGRFVRLRRISNVTRGGMPVVIPVEQVHADNLKLAVRAAQSLRLDVAGVDLITPDIARPWYETACAINEVNAQPSLGLLTAGHLFPEILHWLLDGTDGRIPTVAVVGGNAEELAAVAATIHGRLSESSDCCGLATHEGAWLGADRLAWNDMSGLLGGQLLFGHPRCQSVVLVLVQESLHTQGLPFDSCDVVVRLGQGRVACPFELALLRGARRAIVVDANDGAGLQDIRRAVRAPLLLCGMEGDPRIVEHVAQTGVAVCSDRGSLVVHGADACHMPTVAEDAVRQHLFALAAIVALRESPKP